MKYAVVVLVVRDQKLLMYNRDGAWTVVGGHMEGDESIFECAVRETREEAGIEIKNMKFLSIMESQKKNKNPAYMSFYVLAEYASGDLHPHISEGIESLCWMPIDRLSRLELYPPFSQFISGNNISGLSLDDIFKKVR